jgi:UDP-glucose:(heptosyl)LPS alpha-1,3-glucosyltransferase
MACGVPALLTRVCGVPVHDASNGFLITRNPEDIAAKVKNLRFDPALLSDMRRQCVDFASLYSWDAIADQYLELINAP